MPRLWISSDAPLPMKVLWSIRPAPFPETATKIQLPAELVKVLWSIRYGAEELDPVNSMSAVPFPPPPVKAKPVILVDAAELEATRTRHGVALPACMPKAS